MFRGSQRNGIGAKGMSHVCRGRHGEVGIVEYGLNSGCLRDTFYCFVFVTAQCTLVHMRGLGIACRPSVRPSVCDVGGL